MSKELALGSYSVLHPLTPPPPPSLLPSLSYPEQVREISAAIASALLTPSTATTHTEELTLSNCSNRQDNT